MFAVFGRAFDFALSSSLNLAVAQYVDDFPQVEPKALANSAAHAMDSFFEIVGWRLKDLPPEKKGFHRRFEALGVQFDFSKADKGIIEVRQKEGRLQALEDERLKIMSRGVARGPELDSLRSRISYCRCQTFGGMGAHLLRNLSDLAKEVLVRAEGPLENVLREAVELLKVARPRTIRGGTRKLPPVILCTDGSQEEKTGIGATLWDPHTGKKECFGAIVKEHVVKFWRGDQGERTIHQAELFPTRLAFEHWHRDLHGREVLEFIDNDAARAALVNGLSGNALSARIVHETWLEAARAGSSPWFARVSSPANSVDGPSRGDFSWCRGYGYRVVPLQEVAGFQDGLQEW